MGIISKKYSEGFLVRYDKDPAIPYYEPDGLPGISCEPGTFQNSDGVEISYFFYSAEGERREELILFCPGMGPGHTAYLSEIRTFCERGYRVLTLDYTGCGASGGETMNSVNAPTRDAVELLGHLGIREGFIPVGHSLGGYTALNVSRIMENAHKAVIISGFVGIEDEMRPILKLKILANRVRAHERRLIPAYGHVDNWSYLKKTTDRILWIHSSDDPIVNYKYNAGRIGKIQNPNIRLLTVEGKKHNPQYTEKSLKQMNEWISEYMNSVKAGTLDTLEKKKAFFDDKPISEMTGQDPEIYRIIFDFLDGN